MNNETVGTPRLERQAIFRNVASGNRLRSAGLTCEGADARISGLGVVAGVQHLGAVLAEGRHQPRPQLFPADAPAARMGECSRV
jgi:hypothetical protein